MPWTCAAIVEMSRPEVTKSNWLELQSIKAPPCITSLRRKLYNSLYFGKGSEGGPELEEIFFIGLYIIKMESEKGNSVEDLCLLYGTFTKYMVLYMGIFSLFIPRVSSTKTLSWAIYLNPFSLAYEYFHNWKRSLNFCGKQCPSELDARRRICINNQHAHKLIHAPQHILIKTEW